MGEPVFANVSADYSSYSGIACVVITGPAHDFLENNPGIPVILFSWIDPALTPEPVKLIFDDSPLTLAVRALKPLPSGEILVSSRPTALPGKFEDRKDYRMLRALIKEKYPK